jgi:SHS2 domain-containing protein
MERKGFKIIEDLTSDVMFEAYGKNLKEVFENAALAMFSIICDIEKVSPEKKLDVIVKGENEKDLLVNWLQELIALVDTEGMFFSRFSIKGIGKKSLDASISGEKVSPGKGNTVVKAVTYHKLKLEKTASGYSARVVVDI